jgi:beta-ureidopropionase / N-carbamoyl-L-amino-acid hydrolase
LTSLKFARKFAPSTRLIGEITVADQSAYPRINAERVWQRHMELAAIGATSGGGVHRLALSAEDIAAHRLLADWAAARDFTTEVDGIGNMFIRRQGTDPSAVPVASGSHTDTQPFGGRFDGAFGVLAAFEALETFEDHAIATDRPVEVTVWNNEEGARFMPGLSGSAVYTGALDLDEMLACRDADGIIMAECVAKLHAALGDADRRELGIPYAGFIEAHIEQATILEDNGKSIGIVTDIQGNRRFEVDVVGEAAHSGTTPRARRRDAFVAATDIAVALRRVFEDQDDVARFTIGLFKVLPGAKSVVPGRVEFFIDFRHPSAAALKELGDQVSVVAEEHQGRCVATVREVSRAAPEAFSDAIIDRVAAAADRHGFPSQRIISGAGHDARFLKRLCPTGMVFIPCKDGISHNEKESATPSDIGAGSQVVSDVLLDLAGRR